MNARWLAAAWLCLTAACNGDVNGGPEESGGTSRDGGDERPSSTSGSGGSAGSKPAAGAGSHATDGPRAGSGSSAKDAGAMSASDASSPKPDAATMPKDSGTIDPPASSDPACPTGAILCEDFESGDELDASKWNPGDGSAAQRHFKIDGQVAKDGSRSVHLRYGTGTGDGSMFFATKQGLPAPDDRLYLRYYIRFKDTTFPGFHPILASLAEKDVFSVFSIPTIGFGTIRGEPALEAITSVLDNAQIWSDHTLKAETWACMELMFWGGTGPEYDDEEVKVWVDGKEIEAMHGTDERWFDPNVKRWSPKYDGIFLRFGAASFPPADGEGILDYWIDSVVVSHQPIGCL